METYRNLGNDSGIKAYKLGVDYIIVQFTQGQFTFYKYTNSSAGNQSVEHMKGLAQKGRGLNSYISINKPGFISKASSLQGLL